MTGPPDSERRIDAPAGEGNSISGLFGAGTSRPEGEVPDGKISKDLRLTSFLYGKIGAEEWTPNYPDLMSPLLSGQTTFQIIHGVPFIFDVNREKYAHAKSEGRKDNIVLKVSVERRGEQPNVPVEKYHFAKGTPEFSFLEALLVTVPHRRGGTEKARRELFSDEELIPIYKAALFDGIEELEKKESK